MTLRTDDYRDAVRHPICAGCRGALSGPDHTQQMRDWHDKPHRLVLDLCDEIDRIRGRMDGGPVRLCCGQRHSGARCPDGLVMCCLCFERVPVDRLHHDHDGTPVDVCRPCAEAQA